MKKKNLIKKLQLKRTQVSNFSQEQVVGGGSRYICEPIDLSIAETCVTQCDLTVTCTNYTNCNQYTFANCSVNCPTNGCGTNNCGTNVGCGTGGNSGGISCPGYEC
ncbi:hypothetical protein [uncultured Kordia sp.]|uniref:hypothetical protein n=1 Tax=uncultured Kordia sp. TaxID=507699 RepID=UPI002620A0CA|nr:hypothetical protein [uncultured Kordia sp.]